MQHAHAWGLPCDRCELRQATDASPQMPTPCIMTHEYACIGIPDLARFAWYRLVAFSVLCMSHSCTHSCNTLCEPLAYTSFIAAVAGQRLSPPPSLTRTQVTQPTQTAPHATLTLHKVPAQVLVVKVVAEQHEHLWCTDGNVSVHKVTTHLQGTWACLCHTCNIQ